ncbi:MAG: response regulator transcription factor, partial [Thermoanaerobaculia bacterium]
DDDRDLVDLLSFALRRAGFSPLSAYDAPGALKLLEDQRPDLAVLDVNLGAWSGFELLKDIRRTSEIPVVMLSGRGSEGDIVRGLELGADDYVVKPFSARELLARVEAVLRRSPDRPQAVRRLQLAGGEVDLDLCEVRLASGGCEELSKLEADVLRYLAKSPDRIVSRDELLARVWQQKPHLVATRSVDMTIARLRKKLGGRDVLVTVRGKGYRLNP